MTSESAILKLNDLLSNKETEAYSITGRITDASDGTFRCKIEPEANFKEGVSHYVYLKSFTGWSYFPNVDNANNKFIYWKHETIPTGNSKISWIQYTINIPPGSYQITDYNDMIHMQMLVNGTVPSSNTVRSGEEIKSDPKDEYAISIFPYIPTSRIMVRVKKGYKVGFIEGTWFKELGFNKGTFLLEGLHTAPNRADLMKTLKVRIECNLCKGFRINGKSSNVLYEFPNNVATGKSISLNPNPVIYTTLIQKKFNEITLQFKDDDDKPVNFQNEEFNVL